MPGFVSVAALLTIVIAGVLPPGGSFTDDDNNVHEGGIEAIDARNITLGCNPPFNDRFCPDRQLTRAEMATMISRARGLPPTDADFFTDDDGHVLEGAINRIATAGITQGCNPPDNDSFCPDRPLSRAEAAGFLARALKLPASATNFFVDDDGHVLEGAINRIAAVGITKGCNPPTNNRFCPNRALTRAEMATMMTRALGLTSMKPPDRPPLAWELVVGGLSSPVQALAPPGEDRLLIAQLGGMVLISQGGSVDPTPFLDLSGTVVTGGERGLLSIALHPDYPTDRRMFAWYSGPLQSGGSGNHTTYLVEFEIAVDLKTASSPRIVLAVDQPAGNHNGGFLGFGDDGYLYLGLGDGGGSNDSAGNNARDLSSLLGKMIRIDVDGSEPYEIPGDNPYVGKAGRDEIWASGLRNPWRWSFDGGNLYIGDVGQGSREEVDVVVVAPVGYDLGWARYEGTICNPDDADPSCSMAGLTMPVAEYSHSVGSSITGGRVYRGGQVRSLTAYYVYADFITGVIRSFRLLNGSAVESADLTSQLAKSGIVDFSVDSDGEILVTSLFDGSIYRVVGG